MDRCKFQHISVTNPVHGKKCAVSDAFTVSDLSTLRGHWDLSTCSLAQSLDVRILVLNRGSEYVKHPCCNLFIPLGWGDDYVLLDYLPVIVFNEAPYFKKQRCYEVSIAAPSKYDVSIYDGNFGVLIVDVRQGRTLVSGETVRVMDFNMGTLKIRIDASTPCGAVYGDLIRDLTTIDEPKKFAGRTEIEPNQTPVVGPVHNNGWLKLR